MDGSTVSIIVAAIALVTSLGGVVLTNRYTARAAERAHKRTKELETGKVDAEAYKRARENYDAAIAQAERRITRLREEIDEDRQEHSREMKEMTDRIDRLEADRARNREYIKKLTRDLHELSEWGREVSAILRSRGIPFPPPPIDLGDTDPDGMPPLR